MLLCYSEIVLDEHILTFSVLWGFIKLLVFREIEFT